MALTGATRWTPLQFWTLEGVIAPMVAQAQSESLLHWLYTNAPAAWISALIALVLLALQLRKRPRKLVVREMPSTSFVTVDPGMRHRITTTFDGRQISALSMVVYELYNDGSDPIQNAAFTVTLPAATIVLNAAVRPRDCEPKCECSGADNVVSVSLPYLNPFREHKQLLRLYVLADGETRHAKVNGSGEGWSVRYSPLPGLKQMRKWRIAQTGSLVLTFAAILAYLWYLQRAFGIEPTEFSWRSAAAMVPVFALFAAYTYGWDRASKRIWRRTVKQPQQNEPN